MLRTISTGLLALAAAAVPSAGQAVLQKLTASDSSFGHWYGLSVSVDGGFAAVGDPRFITGPQGRVHVYRLQGNDWLADDVVTAPGGHAADAFGFAVDVDDAFGIERLVVGAELFGAPANEKGKAFVYRRQLNLFPNPPSWELESELVSPFALSQFTRFGASVAIDGGRAVVGAPREDLSFQDMGVIFLYRLEAGGWVIDDVIAAPDAVDDALFGQAVDLRGDTVYVGAPGANGASAGSGAAYAVSYTHLTLPTIYSV